jgi:hypothetical protein
VKRQPSQPARLRIKMSAFPQLDRVKKDLAAIAAKVRPSDTPDIVNRVAVYDAAGKLTNQTAPRPDEPSLGYFEIAIQSIPTGSFFVEDRQAPGAADKDRLPRGATMFAPVEDGPVELAPVAGLHDEDTARAALFPNRTVDPAKPTGLKRLPAPRGNPTTAAQAPVPALQAAPAAEPSAPEAVPAAEFDTPAPARRFGHAPAPAPVDLAREQYDNLLRAELAERQAKREAEYAASAAEHAEFLAEREEDTTSWTDRKARQLAEPAPITTFRAMGFF